MTFYWGLEMSAVSKQCECCFLGPSINDVKQFLLTLPFHSPQRTEAPWKKFAKTVTEWYGTIPILRQQRDWLGGVKKMAIFADIHYYLCWRRVYGWARKSLKMCWSSMMVPILNNLNFSHKPEFFSCHVWSKKFRLSLCHPPNCHFFHLSSFFLQCFTLTFPKNIDVIYGWPLRFECAIYCRYLTK